MQISTRPHKVLFVITKSNWGGAQKYVYDLATELHKQGYQTMVAAGGNGEMIERLEESHIPIRRLHRLRNDSNPISTLPAFLELISLYRKEKPDVVHVNSSKVGLLGTLAARITGIKTIVFTAHGWPFNEDRPEWQKKLFRLLMQITVACTHKTIAVSKSTLESLRAPHWVEKKCIVIYNGISPISFKPATAFYEEKRMMRREKTTFVSIGELHPSKGFDLALSYLKDLQDLSWEWFILGEGKQRYALDKMIQEHNLTSRVHLLGHTKNASQYLKAFDVFFIPSRTEALGYVALEAIQTDLPIIASKVGGIPEILENDPGTLFVQIRDKETKEILKALLTSPVKKIDVSDRTLLREEFSIEHMVTKTKEVYLSR